MAYDNPGSKDSGGMGDCVACPHCGKPIYLSDKGGGEMPHNEEEESFEDGLRKHMSPRADEGGMEAM